MADRKTFRTRFSSLFSPRVSTIFLKFWKQVKDFCFVISKELTLLIKLFTLSCQNKSKRFIKTIANTILYIPRKVYWKAKGIHSLILQTDLENMKGLKPQNPYHVLLSFSLDVIGYGLSIAFVMWSFGFHINWHTPIALGMLLWLVITITLKLGKAIRGQE